MEIILTTSLLLLFSTLFVLLLRNIRNLKAFQAIKLPPGPPKLPFIGSLHHLFGELPHRRLCNLAKKYGPLLHLKLGEVNYIIISSPKYAEEAMKTHDIDFASRPEFHGTKIILYGNTDIAFSPYGKYWSQIKKICSVELLSSKRVESFGFIREEVGEHLVEKIKMANESPVNLSEMFLSLTNMIISRTAFGMGCSHQDKFNKIIKKALNYMSGFNFADFYPSMSFLGDLIGSRAQLEGLHRQFDEILEEIFKEHQAKNLNEDCAREDIVDILFRLKNHGELDNSLTTNNIKAIILDLFLGGVDTSTSTMEWVMSELVRHPHIMKKVQSEVRKVFEGKEKVEMSEVCKLPYLSQVVKETMRFRPVAPFLIPRVSCNTVEIGDYTIPIGTRILINAWAIMRDPIYWVDPERFWPERFDEKTIDFKGTKFEYIPFGSGRRMCPGIAFAISGIEYWLAQLLFYFDWKLPDGKMPEELDMDESFGLTLSRQDNLLLVATPYKHSPIK